MLNYSFVKSLPGDTNFEAFQKLPQKLYEANQLRYKQTESVSTEHLKACYILYKNNEPVARYALYENLNLFYNNKRTACIGSYECIKDDQAANILLSHAKQEAKNLNVDFLIGPMEGSTWNNYRFSDHNDEPNFFLEPYLQTYYNRHFIANSFTSIAQYESTLATKFEVNQFKLLELENSLQAKGLTFRQLNLENISSELKRICDFSNDAFKENFLYTPINPSLFIGKYTKVIPFINPEYILIAEESNGNIAGVHFCYDAMYVHKKTLVVKTLARNKNRSYAGLGNYLLANLIHKAFANGYEAMIYAFMFKENAMAINLSNKFNAVPYKSYSLYGCELNN